MIFRGAVRSLSRSKLAKCKSNAFQEKQLEDLHKAHPNHDRRDPYCDPNFINPEGSRLDPYDKDKGGYG